MIVGRGSRSDTLPGGMTKRLGRAVLWCLVAVLLIRGAAGLLAREQSAPAARSSQAAAPAWPDDDARAFAADFARAYLSYSPKDPEASADAVRAFVAPELASSVVPEYGEDAPRRAVGSVSVARVARIDELHARITVAAATTGGTRYVTVPVARDAHGGLVVSELPSLAAPPARASVPASSLESVPARERGAIEDVVRRSLSAYLAGDAGELAYYARSGVRIGALDAEHELVDVVSGWRCWRRPGAAPAWCWPRSAPAMRPGVGYQLAYRLELVREDRWLVAAVDSTTRRGG